jgi:hypothetical protein
MVQKQSKFTGQSIDNAGKKATAILMDAHWA